MSGAGGVKSESLSDGVVASSYGRVPRQRGNEAQPQNLPPRFGPVLAVRSTIWPLQVGQSGGGIETAAVDHV